MPGPDASRRHAASLGRIGPAPLAPYATRHAPSLGPIRANKLRRFLHCKFYNSRVKKTPRGGVRREKKSGALGPDLGYLACDMAAATACATLAAINS